jgi:hypothetical protein
LQRGSTLSTNGLGLLRLERRGVVLSRRGHPILDGDNKFVKLVKAVPQHSHRKYPVAAVFLPPRQQQLANCVQAAAEQFPQVFDGRMLRRLAIHLHGAVQTEEITEQATSRYARAR